MNLGLRDRVVWVTGASGGIGRAVATAFAAEGARVVAHGFRSAGALPAWCDPLGIRVVHGDLVDAACADQIVADILAHEGRLDVVIANAGRWPEPDTRVDQTSAEAIRQALDDNLVTALHTARAFFGALARTGPHPDGRGACLLFTGSTAGRFGEAGHIGYAAAKAALRGVVLTLKNEIVALDPRGRVNLVEPGWTRTPAVASFVTDALVDRVTTTSPLRRIADPGDIAAAMLFFASPVAAAHVTGETLTVAGGMEGRRLRSE